MAEPVDPGADCGCPAVHGSDKGEGKQVRWYALIVTLITFLITVRPTSPAMTPA